MGETLWTDRKPGEPFGVGVVDGVPDWVRTPPGMPEIGEGVKLRVLNEFFAPCPMCERSGESTGNVRHLTLERRVLVAECEVPGHGFMWYMRRTDS